MFTSRQFFAGELGDIVAVCLCKIHNIRVNVIDGRRRSVRHNRRGPYWHGKDNCRMRSEMRFGANVTRERERDSFVYVAGCNELLLVLNCC